MKQQEILVSGAGIAGPALAYWLGRAGAAVTVVERARALRTGGQAVDFRGPVHRAILEKMGLWEAVHAHQTHGGEHSMLDGHGRQVAVLPAFMFSGEVEILRGTLSRLLYERTQSSASYLFGESIRGLEQDAEGVRVTFEHGAPRAFDLVIGADGLHSRVRQLTLGDEAQFLEHHGYQVAGFSMPNVFGIDEKGETLSVVGRGLTLSTGRQEDHLRALFCFRTPPSSLRLESAERQRQVHEAFAGLGWRVPRVLDAMGQADDIYFDSISSVHLPSYSQGRVALAGDAAWGGTLGGTGTPLALIGAYVLAGELARAPGDHPLAFARYEALMRPYATLGLGGTKHVGDFFAPRSRLSMFVRNAYLRLFSTRPFRSLFKRLTHGRAEGFTLPEYAFPHAAPPRLTEVRAATA